VVFRLLGLLGGLSVATDLGAGAPMEEALKRCVVATRLAQRLGCADEQVRDVVYTSLLQHLGCTAYSHELGHVWGDDIAATRLAYLTNFEDSRDVRRTFISGMAEATGHTKSRVFATAFISGRRIDAAGPVATCEVARDAARRLGLSQAVQQSLFQTQVMWNGKGYPPASGEEITLGTRIMHVASTAVMFLLHADIEVALDQVERRSGTYLDPQLVDAFSADLLDGIADVDGYEAALACEPDPVRLIDPAAVEDVARTFGDLVDLKSPWLQGHSSAVAELAGASAERLGLHDAASVRVAGHLHDLGRVGVPSRIWAKAGPLSGSERDQARLHPYHTERILSRVPSLAEVTRMASQHHERCDGRGYHRGLAAAQLSMPSRVLAAADCYRSHVEERPYRPAASASEASDRVKAEVRSGRLDGDAVAAVLEAAGHRQGVRRPRPAGLTERQVDVLRLVAAGLSNHEVARRLVISNRTAEHHVQDVYLKIGTSTRAGAALFAMEHGLIDKPG
jgi:HD-GYP domain-containing protein (c-di-GMP phosphodiesterase class II)